MDNEKFEESLEQAYWGFDARQKGYGEWKSRPQSERDAFKMAVRAMMAIPTPAHWPTVVIDNLPAQKPSGATLRCRRCGDVYDMAIHHGASFSHGVGESSEPNKQEGSPAIPATSVSAGVAEPVAWYSAKLDDCITNTKKEYRKRHFVSCEWEHFDQPLYGSPPSVDGRDVLLRQALEALEAEFTQQSRPSRTGVQPSALSGLIESAYMQAHGIKTQAAILALRAATSGSSVEVAK